MLSLEYVIYRLRQEFFVIGIFKALKSTCSAEKFGSASCTFVPSRWFSRVSPWGTAWQPRIWSCWCKMTRAQPEPLQKNMSLLGIHHERLQDNDGSHDKRKTLLRNVIMPMWRRRIPSFSRLAAQRTYMNLKQRGLILVVLMEHAHKNIPLPTWWRESQTGPAFGGGSTASRSSWTQYSCQSASPHHQAN